MKKRAKKPKPKIMAARNLLLGWKPAMAYPDRIRKWRDRLRTTPKSRFRMSVWGIRLSGPGHPCKTVGCAGFHATEALPEYLCAQFYNHGMHCDIKLAKWRRPRSGRGVKDQTDISTIARATGLPRDVVEWITVDSVRNCLFNHADPNDLSPLARVLHERFATDPEARKYRDFKSTTGPEVARRLTLVLRAIEYMNRSA